MPSTAEPAGLPSRLRFIASFAALFALLQVTFLALDDTPVQGWVIDRATVGVAARLLGWFDPAAAVTADGHRLASPTARLNVLHGCEGTELYFLWAAAVLAFPAPRRWRLAGLAAGLTVAFALNQVRIVGLFYVVRDHRPAFDLVHGYVAPGLLVALLGLGFWYWSGRTSRA